jgi:glutaredoxin
MILTLIRWILARVILTWNGLFAPKVLVHRSPEEQAQVDAATRSLTLYQFHACPFCVKVRRQLQRLQLKIELRDAQNDEKSRAELLAGGGELQVPCLRIEENGATRWLYESSDINAYLSERFGSPSLQG